ncbi:hypothetical protein [Streptomyces decoyicus]|uniref:hypothetical protein n=1 Tax=Streptomyces decoyicus TaxID=249567 RepID=UPI00366525AC
MKSRESSSPPHRPIALRPGQNPSLDLTAFCQLHQPVYLHYAFTRTGNEACARDAVDQALADLALRWQFALESPCPATVAWELLSQAAAFHDTCCSENIWCAVYELLGAQQADVVVLHRQLHLDVETIATLVGANPLSVRLRLGAADATLANRSVDHAPAHFSPACITLHHPLETTRARGD